MSSYADPTVASPPAPRSARWISALSMVVLLIGLVSAVVGVSYAVNALTIVGATVKVPVAFVAPEGAWDAVHLTVEGVDIDNGWITTLPPTGIGAGGLGGQVTIAAWGSTYLEQILSRGWWLVSGLAMLVGAILLRPVLVGIAAGAPFAGRASRHLGTLAVVVLVAGHLAPLLPQLAGFLVLDRLGLAESGIFSMSPHIGVEVLFVAALVGTLAVAFRSGEQLARDADGLV